MEKVLVSSNKTEARETKNNWDTEKRNLQKVIDTYNKLKLPALANSDELNSLLNWTEHFIFNQLTGGEKVHLTIGTGEDRTHLPVNHHEAMKLITKPKGYDELLTEVAVFADKCSKRYLGRPATGSYNCGNTIQFFKIDESGELAFTEKTENIIEDAGNKYAYSARGIAAFNLVKGVEKALIESGINPHWYNTDDIGYLINLFAGRINKQDKTISLNHTFFTSDANWLHEEKKMQNQ